MANDRKLIPADAGCVAAEYVEKHVVVGDSEFLRGYVTGVKAMAEQLQNLPAVDAVEVVRCKDCKHWNEETGFCEQRSHFSENGMWWDVYGEEEFCSDGERRAGE